MKIIEITRGTKPEGHCFKFGVTTEFDYYIAPLDVKLDAMPDWDVKNKVKSFMDKVKGITKRSSFKYSKQFKEFNDKHLFPKLRE